MRANVVVCPCRCRHCFHDLAKLYHCNAVCYTYVRPAVSSDGVRHSVYALYERNHKLALALFVFIIAETGVSLWLDLTPSISRSKRLPNHRRIWSMMLIFALVDVFAALGVPQVGNAPAMRCKLRYTKVNSGRHLTSLIFCSLRTSAFILVVSVEFTFVRICSNGLLLTCEWRIGLASNQLRPK